MCVFVFGCRDNNVTDTETGTEATTENPEAYYKEARESIYVVVQSLESKDAELLKSILTDYTIKETPNLDKEIRLVFDMYEGEFVEIKEHMVSSTEITLCDEVRNVCYMYYDVTTTEKEYVLEVLYIPENDSLFTQTGFFSVVLADYDRDWKYFLAAHPYLDFICGVFSSDLDTIEYNEDKIGKFYEEIGLEQCQEAVRFELNKVGIEKISEFQVVQITDWGGVDYTIVDSLNNKYYICTNEIGFVQIVYENDINGKVLYDSLLYHHLGI